VLNSKESPDKQNRRTRIECDLRGTGLCTLNCGIMNKDSFENKMNVV
jgi:hypothetical protein